MILTRVLIVTVFVSCLFAIGMLNATGDASGQLALGEVTLIETAVR